ncbi:serine/threonine-protein kinase [Actinorugispora endophytica]|uniref:Serine/threonine protein kinase n=1 Tax=Actinorugispora endophytica TaxID=1605990 RepID=A0A4R6UEZ1_9ACTN|nr:serine/threonine-protein kinase [Actinorugispora endophytica]TDQ45380.1 serine/threonine protein kinase [Actinorugispora endophytica]
MSRRSERTISVLVPPDLTPTASEDPRQIGPYALVGRLGSGRTGTVYAAVHPTVEPDVLLAVKTLPPSHATDPASRALLDARLRALSGVDGRCYVPPVAFDAQAATPWLAMRYAPGTQLSRYARKRGPMSPGRLIALAAGLGECLSTLHALDLAHGDLKPGNILLSSSGPRVLDCVLPGDPDVVRRSAAWTAPERHRGAPPGEASDVFAWGAVLAFAATGRLPFGEGEPESLAQRVGTAEPDLDGVPDEMRPLLESALAKDPEQRPGVRDVVRGSIALWEEGLGTVGTEAGPGSGVTRLLHREWQGIVEPALLPRVVHLDERAKGKKGWRKQAAAAVPSAPAVPAPPVPVAPVPAEPAPAVPPTPEPDAPAVPAQAGPVDPVEPEAAPSPAPKADKAEDADGPTLPGQAGPVTPAGPGADEPTLPVSSAPSFPAPTGPAVSLPAPTALHGPSEPAKTTAAFSTVSGGAAPAFPSAPGKPGNRTLLLAGGGVLALLLVGGAVWAGVAAFGGDPGDEPTAEPGAPAADSSSAPVPPELDSGTITVRFEGPGEANLISGPWSYTPLQDTGDAFEGQSGGEITPEDWGERWDPAEGVDQPLETLIAPDAEVLCARFCLNPDQLSTDGEGRGTFAVTGRDLADYLGWGDVVVAEVTFGDRDPETDLPLVVSVTELYPPAG